MSPDHWSNLTWDTVSAGGYDLFGSNRLLGPDTRPCVQTESHSYSRREADQRYKRISLQQDFTRTEITAFNEKLKEAKEMNRNNGDETKYFVVRGPHTKLEIRKIEAKHRPRTQNTRL